MRVVTTVLLTAGSVLLTNCSDAPKTAVPATVVRKNPVVIYVVDTLRADRLGILGYPGGKAPNLDALAKESVVFERAYAAAPWTLPSMTSVITSTPLCAHGVADAKKTLSPKLNTIAEQLKAKGYRTGALYNNFHVGAISGLDRSYDVSKYRPEQDDNALPDIKAYLDTVGSDPFLMYVHTREVHHPFATPYEFTKPFGHIPPEEKEGYLQLHLSYRMLKFADSSSDRPLGTTDNTDLQNRLKARLETIRPLMSRMYDASVYYADDNLGKVIAELKARKLWDDTLFIFLADHGEELGEHGGWFHDQSVYEELVHVPFMIKFPQSEFAGRRIADRVSLLDVKPTLYAALGQAGLCDQCRGLDLLPLLQGAAVPRTPGSDAVSLRANFTTYYKPLKQAKGDTNLAMRRDNWKVIWNEEPETVELYNLATDPGELQNRSASEPELSRELRDEAVGWLETCRASAPGVEIRELDDRAKQQLRSMGYF